MIKVFMLNPKAERQARASSESRGQGNKVYKK